MASDCSVDGGFCGETPLQNRNAIWAIKFKSTFFRFRDDFFTVFHYSSDPVTGTLFQETYELIMVYFRPVVNLTC